MIAIDERHRGSTGPDPEITFSAPSFGREGPAQPPRQLWNNRAVLGHGWKMQWNRVLRRLDDVRTVYAGREDGTDSAVDAVQSFFEAIHHLKDWLGNDSSTERDESRR